MKKKMKRTLLGIQKNKKCAKINQHRFIKYVVDYLKADSYLFAPLISPSRPDFGAVKFSPSSATGLNIKEPITGRKRKLLGKVEEYLKSDDYMYASLVSRRPIRAPASSGKLQYIRRVTMDISTRKLTMEENQLLYSQKI